MRVWFDVDFPHRHSEAADADELFIAVTTKDIIPVVRFDDKTISTGRPGKYTKLLIQKFQSYVILRYSAGFQASFLQKKVFDYRTNYCIIL